ncbi:hypothetical protein LC040_04365 [Bacillus tianshenii]|nr:hypothetical protein LC040_04365 [Bacillus tianshenii]
MLKERNGNEDSLEQKEKENCPHRDIEPQCEDNGPMYSEHSERHPDDI